MVAESERLDLSPSSAGDREEERAPNTIFNALIGAAVSVVLGFIPFSPVLGGGVAGYLEEGEFKDGAKVGAISGALAAIPLALVLVLISSIFIFVPSEGGVGLSLVFLAVIIVLLVYTVGLSLLGGVLGVYIKKEVY